MRVIRTPLGCRHSIWGDSRKRWFDKAPFSSSSLFFSIFTLFPASWRRQPTAASDRLLQPLDPFSRWFAIISGTSSHYKHLRYPSFHVQMPPCRSSTLISLFNSNVDQSIPSQASTYSFSNPIELNFPSVSTKFLWLLFELVVVNS